MSELANTLPCCRRELVFSAPGDEGRYVVKDPHAGDYYCVGEEEYFLLTQFNGLQSPGSICATFAERFGERFDEVRLLIPYDEGARLAELYALGTPVDERVDRPEGVFVRAHLPRREVRRFAPFLIAEAEARSSA